MQQVIWRSLNQVLRGQNGKSKQQLWIECLLLEALKILKHFLGVINFVFSWIKSHKHKIFPFIVQSLMIQSWIGWKLNSKYSNCLYREHNCICDPKTHWLREEQVSVNCIFVDVGHPVTTVWLSVNRQRDVSVRTCNGSILWSKCATAIWETFNFFFFFQLLER